MNHLQPVSSVPSMMEQRADHGSSQSMNPLPWLIRQLVKEQTEQATKKDSVAASSRTDSPAS